VTVFGGGFNISLVALLFYLSSLSPEQIRLLIIFLFILGVEIEGR